MLDYTTLGLSFIEGVALILSPCILPILPLMLGASIDGGKARPFGIVMGFVLAFTVFAVASRTLLAAADIDSEVIRNTSLALLFLFGLVMLFPKLSDRWAASLSGFAGKGDSLIGRIQGDGFLSGLAIGLLVGVVWTPCAGPILGAAILHIIQAESELQAGLSIAAFATGAGIPMFLIAMSGRKIMNRLGFLKRHSDGIRRFVGIVMIAAAIMIFSGFDLKLVAWQAQSQAQESSAPTLSHMLDEPYEAPEIHGIEAWINSDPLTLESLKGKVVLIDFWTYSCINCIRTMPYITQWYEKYKDDGFVIIGVHAPEFPFEKKLKNVEDAVKEYGITYPVALDNDFATWRAYKNRYWPAHYLIDREGRVVYTHFGEGKYAQTENNIRALLGVRGASDVQSPTIRIEGQSPETYLGFGRAENFKSPGGFAQDARKTYAFPETLAQNDWAFAGDWTVKKQSAVAGDNAALRYHFRAGKVHIVMGPADGKPVTVDVSLDGRQSDPITVSEETLYTIYDAGTFGPRDGTIEIKPRDAGLEVYAFTFGK